MDMSNDIAFADVFRDSLIQGWANIRIDWGRFGEPDRVVECDIELNPLAAIASFFLNVCGVRRWDASW